MLPKSILVTGANGQLGKSLQSVASQFPELKFFFASREEADLENFASISLLVEKHNFSHCINCAAYTAVDKAESEKQTAMQINGFAVGELATLCNKKNIQLIHFSTDYVFNGNATSPYDTSTTTDPVNYYGETKLMGEKLALQHNKNAIVIRTSWVYSPYGNNFVKTMLRLMNDRPEINVVNDQFGSPTSALDLARAVLHVIRKGEILPGLYHYSNTGIISWFEFARSINALIESTCIINEVPTSQYPTPAKRPTYSALDTSKIAAYLETPIPEWSSSLRECIKLLR